MDRPSHIEVVLPLLLLLALLGRPMSADERKPEMQRGPARCPHGPSLKTPCGSCHTSTSWSPIRAIPEFDHNRETIFPLRGMHEKVKCGLCHTKLVFSEAGTNCADCHADIHRSQFGAKCEDCHTVRGWQVGVKSIQEHSARFPLIGAHATVTCDTCHAGAATGQFVGLSTQCASCHINDFNTAKSVDHRAAGFSLTCESCHNMNTWLGVKFDHSATGFVLSGAHAMLTCVACHVGGRFKGTPADCFSCHVSDFNATNNPAHATAGFPKDCSVCHSTLDWNNAKFDHSASQFPLTGAHLTVACNACHIGGRFVGTPTACYSCHVAEFNSTTNPNHRDAGLPTDCSQCHTTVNWQNAKFDHSLSKFLLTGAHATVPCNSCHVGGQFSNAPTTCVGCHLTDFNKTASPSHVTSGFPQSCDTCHTTTAWQPASFDHSKTTFPLTGAHVGATCLLCHVNNNFTTLPLQCSGCHMTDFNKTTSPNHVATGFPQTCDTCHTTTAWQPASFDHSKTGFPLTGTHLTAACALCHVGNDYNLTSGACYPCHTTDFKGATNPNHVSAAFPQDCSLCHTTVNWNGAAFDHGKTGFALTGAHLATACALCHVGNNYNLTSGACYPCHTTDFKGATDPNHVSAAFPQDCSLCHTTVNWSGAVFDHGKTGFALTGAHIPLQCALCHVNNNYTLTSGACYPCHTSDFKGTNNPPHVSAGFPQDCTLCHTTTNWTGATFNHSTTGFALTGTHLTTPCLACHVGNNYKLTSGACYPCHTADFTGTTNPPHIAAGFPQDCSLCHSTVNWTSATFNHSNTGFPLTGAHIPLQCAQCHVNNNYSLTSGACYPCHTTDYNGTTNPNHVSAGFPQDCSLCHSTASWTSATFNHSTTGFALTGTHLTTPCLACHVGNNYKLTSGACYPCHTVDYTGTNNPPHVASGFPQDCSLCHSTVNWSGAVFDHSTTGFALTGTHLTAPCLACHVGNNYKLTSGACYPCHTANFTGATNPNHVAAGFPQDCSLCHTTVNWAGATFNHNNTPFPLTGAHVSVACTACHINNVFAGTPTDCYSCHKADYTGTNNPNHVAAGFPTTCATCHTTTAWTGAVFNHTWFPITSGNHKQPCAVCHINSADYTAFSCTATCHAKASTDPHHSGVRNYVYNATSCYGCHPTGRGD